MEGDGRLLGSLPQSCGEADEATKKEKVINYIN